MWISDHSEKQLTSQLKKITAKELHRVKVGHAASNALIFSLKFGNGLQTREKKQSSFQGLKI